jgi:hypothetical protein
VGLAIEHGSSLLPGEVSCLPRSIVAQSLLAREGIAAKVRIGVKFAGDSFAAHAWLEHEDRVLYDDPELIATFAPFEGDLTPELAAAMQ